MVDWAFKTDYMSFSVVCVCKFASLHATGSLLTYMRDLEKSTDYLLIFVSEWTSRDWCAHVTLGLCVCLTWLLFDR